MLWRTNTFYIPFVSEPHDRKFSLSYHKSRALQHNALQGDELSLEREVVPSAMKGDIAMAVKNARCPIKWIRREFYSMVFTLLEAVGLGAMKNGQQKRLTFATGC